MPSEKQYLDLLVKPERDPYHHDDHPSDIKKTKIPIEGKPNVKPKHRLDYAEYMDLDEFVSTTPRTSQAQQNGTNSNKSSVDLLASLVALGKIIAERQTKPSESVPTISLLSSTATIENNVYMTPSSKHLSGFQSSSSSSSSKESEDVINSNLKSSNGDTLSTSSFSKGEKCTFMPGTDEYVPKSRNRRFIIPGDMKDTDYWTRRERNNRAARKSREQRRMKEMDVLNMVKKIEDENTKLTADYNRLQALNKSLEKEFQMMMDRKKYAPIRCSFNSTYTRSPLIHYQCS